MGNAVPVPQRQRSTNNGPRSMTGVEGEFPSITSSSSAIGVTSVAPEPTIPRPYSRQRKRPCIMPGFKKGKRRLSVLHRLILEAEWQKVLIRSSLFPHELAQPSGKMEWYRDPDIVVKDVLPIHLALACQAPAPVVLHLLQLLPESAQILMRTSRSAMKKQSMNNRSSSTVHDLVKSDSIVSMENSFDGGVGPVALFGSNARMEEGASTGMSQLQNGSHSLGTEVPYMEYEWNAVLQQATHNYQSPACWLALHLACLYRADPAVLAALVQANPTACRVECMGGLLPIHVVCSGMFIPSVLSWRSADEVVTWPFYDCLEVLVDAAPGLVSRRSSLHQLSAAEYLEDTMDESSVERLKCMDLLWEDGESFERSLERLHGRPLPSTMQQAPEGEEEESGASTAESPKIPRHEPGAFPTFQRSSYLPPRLEEEGSQISQSSGFGVSTLSRSLSSSVLSSKSDSSEKSDSLNTYKSVPSQIAMDLFLHDHHSQASPMRTAYFEDGGEESSTMGTSQLSSTSTTIQHLAWARQGPEIQFRATNPMYTLMMAEDWEGVRKMLEDETQDAASSWHYGIEIDLLDSSEPQLWKRLPLHHACRFGAPMWLLKQLLTAYPEGARCCDPYTGRSPLHLLCRYGNLGANLLLEKFSDATRQADMGGRLPLHFACMSSYTDTIHMLLKIYPAGLVVADSCGKTPLDYAMKSTSISKSTKAFFKRLAAIMERVQRTSSGGLEDIQEWDEETVSSMLTDDGDLEEWKKVPPATPAKKPTGRSTRLLASDFQEEEKKDDEATKDDPDEVAGTSNETHEDQDLTISEIVGLTPPGSQGREVLGKPSPVRKKDELSAMFMDGNPDSGSVFEDNDDDTDDTESHSAAQEDTDDESKVGPVEQGYGRRRSGSLGEKSASRPAHQEEWKQAPVSTPEKRNLDDSHNDNTALTSELTDSEQMSPPNTPSSAPSTKVGSPMMST